MASFSFDTYKSILEEAVYAGTQRAELSNLHRFDVDGNASNGYQITYSFMQAVPDYFDGWGVVGFRTPTQALQDAIDIILANIDANTRLDFIKVDDAQASTMRLGMYTTRSGVPSVNDAEAFSPGGYTQSYDGVTYEDLLGSDGEVAGDAFFTNVVVEKGLDPGQAGFGIVLHELLHVLGLKHPFGAGPNLDSKYDNSDYTMMSYNGKYNKTGPSILDVLALRYLYGKPDGVADDAWSSPILTSSGNDKVSGSAAADFIDGKAGNDRLNGGDGADTILGGDGNDKISGDAGNDVLYGGAGVDQLAGGTGADSFVFDYLANGNADKIKDFNVAEGDVFAFDVEIFSALAGGITAGNIVIAANAVAQDADDFLLFSTKGGRLSYDADGSGSGAAVLLAGVKGNLSGLDADNFMIDIGA